MQIPGKIDVNVVNPSLSILRIGNDVIHCAPPALSATVTEADFWPALLIGMVFFVFLVLLPETVLSPGPFSALLGLPFVLFFPISGALMWV